jgi:hypothetical protein
MERGVEARDTREEWNSGHLCTGHGKEVMKEEIGVGEYRFEDGGSIPNNPTYPYHHYHSTSHEALCMIGGSVEGMPWAILSSESGTKRSTPEIGFV